jgi:hypothetical protein
MRVLPRRHPEQRTAPGRRRHLVVVPAPVTGQAPPQPPPRTASAELERVTERRHRASVTPLDRALYRCDCGYQFHAAVSASVACPHCGDSQAW